MKCVPRSLINVSGHSNLVMIFSYINLVATTCVHDSTCPASTHFVKYVMAAIIYLDPVHRPGVGNGPLVDFPHFKG